MSNGTKSYLGKEFTKATDRFSRNIVGKARGKKAPHPGPGRGVLPVKKKRRRKKRGG